MPQGSGRRDRHGPWARSFCDGVSETAGQVPLRWSVVTSANCGRARGQVCVGHHRFSGQGPAAGRYRCGAGQWWLGRRARSVLRRAALPAVSPARAMPAMPAVPPVTTVAKKVKGDESHTQQDGDPVVDKPGHCTAPCSLAAI